jgi:hypothetical protein
VCGALIGGYISKSYYKHDEAGRLAPGVGHSAAGAKYSYRPPAKDASNLVEELPGTLTLVSA